jgi:hypothetical protein
MKSRFVYAFITVATASIAYLAWGRCRKAARAKSALDAIPDLVADILQSIARPNSEGFAHDRELSGGSPGSVDYIDINADGRRELLVQFPSGAHGCALRILGWKGTGFEELARLSVGTPVGFEFQDFDGDGQIEIKTQETDWSAGLPYVTAPRLTLLFRWSGNGLVEVSRGKTASSSRL